MLKLIELQQIELINTIKLLIYKENPTIFEKIDFNDDKIYLEPLLFAYFNKNNEKYINYKSLETLLQGYFINKNDYLIKEYHNLDVLYLPKIGYFKNQVIENHEDVELITKTKIEVIIYPTFLLHEIFRDSNDNVFNENEIIFNKSLFIQHKSSLFNALQFIKTCSNEHYKLIELCCKKIVLFKTDPENTNSFATINAHGIAFLNVYQDDYDEVFFVDDIAHQTGHIILTTMFHSKDIIFLIDENQNIGEILQNNDYRSLYTLLHALFTYYTTFLCLDDCLKHELFDKKQKAESLARIGFYLEKCKIDLENFNEFCAKYNGIQNVLFDEGKKVVYTIIDKYLEIFDKYNFDVAKYNYNEQEYNFSNTIFAKNNNIEI